MVHFMERNLAQMRVHLTHRMGAVHTHPYEELTHSLKKFIDIPCPSGKVSRDNLSDLDRSNYALRLFWKTVQTWRLNKFAAMRCGAQELAYHQDRIFSKPQLLTRDPWPLERSRILIEIEAQGVFKMAMFLTPSTDFF